MDEQNPSVGSAFNMLNSKEPGTNFEQDENQGVDLNMDKELILVAEDELAGCTILSEHLT